MTPSAEITTALAGRYQLERELGRGGMATVYLAHDLKHDREVALKVLRPELAASLGSERFLAEIRLTARLQHAHIVPLFDSGECAGTLYYVMPYVAGESLRALLDRVHRLDVADMLAIARPVAEALAYAHELGIVHRDIKPENILIARGQPFVTDFGIARAVSAAGGERLTATGLAIGTPAYMSPEQVLGEESLDGRSDVYSLGCVIYELLSGEPPFAGATVQALLARRLTGPPPHLAHVPTPVDDVVRRSLATAPQDRFATAQALAEALVEAARRPAQADLSIVVLPFENLSPDPDNAFFADGLTEELIADLSRLQALRVISRTSAMMYRDVRKSVAAIAQELHVRYVLEGSVRRAGTSLRITAQLIDAANDEHMWAEKYSGTIEDVFEIQERVAQAIVEALKVRLTVREERQLGAHPVMDVRAFDCYLQARAENWRSTAESLERALQLTGNALKIVGENATLLSVLGQSHFQFVNVGIDPDPRHLELAADAARRALALEPGNPLAHLLQGEVAWKRTGDMREAVREMRAGLNAAPNNIEVLLVLPYVYAFCGRSEQARPLLARLLEIDPLTPLNHGIAAYVDFFDGRFTAAIPAARRMYEMDPEADISRWIYTVHLGWAGQIEESPWNATWARSAEPDNVLAAVCKFLNLCLLEDPRAPAALTPEFREAARWDEQLSWHIGSCFARLGMADESLDWLENARRKGFWCYPFLSRHDPFLASMRGDPRFHAFLERCRADWASLAS